MKTCPHCGQPRKTDDYQCPACGGFYSKLDEILAEEQAKREQHSVKNRLKRIISADNPKQAFINEWNTIKANTPRRTFITLGVIFCFIFALIVSVV